MCQWEEKENVLQLNWRFAMNSVDFHRTMKFLMSFCSLISSTFSIVVSFLVICFVIGKYFRREPNRKNSSNVSLLLTLNTSLALICSSSTLFLMTLATMSGDFNLSMFQWLIQWFCSLRGYLHFVFINSIYLSYVIQAAFRLFRIAFHERKCLRTNSSFFCYISFQWICSFLFILPILFGNERRTSLIVYLPEEFFCQVPMTSLRGILFSILTVYFLPVCFIALIYLWIWIYIRRRQHFLFIGTSLERQTRRDQIILRRICLVMVILLFLGIPSTLFVFSFFLIGKLHWAAYRLGWMTISISFALMSLSSLYVTPQIYRPIRRQMGKSRSRSQTQT